jgi:hypothetical protein
VTPSARPTPPPPGPARAALERVSLPLLARAARLPRAVPFLVLLALVVAGVLVGGPLGAVLVGLVALAVAWLLVLAWPALTGVERLGRIAVLLLAVALAVVQLRPRG